MPTNYINTAYDQRMKFNLNQNPNKIFSAALFSHNEKRTSQLIVSQMMACQRKNEMKKQQNNKKTVFVKMHKSNGIK